MLLTKKMKSIISLSFILTILLLVGCDNSVTNNYPDLDTDGRVIGTIHGVVTDENTNDRLDSVQVTTVDNGEILSTITDNLGYYAITNLSPGDYEISYSGKSDYAVGIVTVTIPTLQQIGITDHPTNEDFHHTENQDMDLYGLNAGLTGLVYTVVDNENTSLASDVTLIADFAKYDISPDEYIVKTNSEGAFSFTGLPSTPSVSIRSMPFNDGTYDYSVQTATVSLIPNGTASAGNIFLQIASAEPFIVQNNFENDDFGLTENLSMTFSKVMKTNSFEIEIASTYGNVEFEATWSNDITLTIDPYVALQANESYYLSLSGISQDNNSFTVNFSFETQEGIEFVWTNLERLDGVFDEFVVSSDIEITFTMEVDLGNYNGYVRLYDESSLLVSTTESLSADSKTLIIDPLYNLEPGQDYTLNYKVYSTIEGDYDSGNFNFTTAIDVTAPAQVTGFAVDMGDDWTADWNTTSIIFKWNAVDNADDYIIYAKDNGDNTDFVRVASFSAQDYVTDQSGTVYLNSYLQFDYYDDDGVQTPFSGGTELTFKIVAYNDAGEGTFSDAVVVKDETAPTGYLNQSGSAHNYSSTDTQTFTVSFTAYEYLDATTPSYGFIENGGDADYVLRNSSVSFEWNSDMKGGVFTIMVPADSDGSGDIFYIDGFKDSSGNTVDESISINLF